VRDIIYNVHRQVYIYMYMMIVHSVQ
jgi:hypothetical protein